MRILTLCTLVLALAAGAANAQEQTNSWEARVIHDGRVGSLDLIVSSHTAAATAEKNQASHHSPIRCRWWFGLTASETIELISGTRQTINTLDPGDTTIHYNAAWCTNPLFAGNTSYIRIWLVGEPVPIDVIQALAQQAIANAQPPPPAIQSNPNGQDTPYLVNLPTWWHLTNTDIHQATAAIPNAAITATLTPTHSTWTTTDGQHITCETTQPWQPKASTDHPGYCGMTFTTPGPISIDSTVHYTVTLTCTPAPLCTGLNTPGTITTNTTFDADIAYVRGLRTSAP